MTDPFTAFPPLTAADVARGIWRQINLVNLLENIEPTRERANVVLRKSVDDAISRARGKFALDGFDSAEAAVRTVRDEAGAA